MSVKQWLFEKKIDFLYQHYRGGDRATKNQILSVLDLSADEVEALSFSRFRKILAHAYENCPYYREKYQKAGLAPADIKTPEDIEKIPILTREEVKENRENILCRNADRKKIFLTSTGGSTGTPLYFYHEHTEPYAYMRQRFLKMIGLPSSENGAMVIRRNNTFINRCKVAFWNWPVKLLFLNAKMMTKESVMSFIKAAKRANIKYLWGYEGGLQHLASFLAENDLSIPSVTSVISTSSPLPQSHRKLLQNTFHCDVYDQYGSCEVQWLGTECPEHHGLHIPWDVRRIEFVDETGKNVPVGEYGDIVVTDLLNYSFPFIRYRNGDRGRRLEGHCRIPLPLMDSVKGRTTDLIKFQDGSCIAGDYLTTIFDDFPMAVKAFQVIQRKDHSIELHYIPSGTRESQAEINEVVTRLQDLIGSRAPVRPQEVSEIRHDGGKTRFVISEIR